MIIEVVPLRLHKNGLCFSGPNWLEDPLDLDVPWHERPRVSVETASEQSLIEAILHQASRELGLTFQERWRYGYWADGLFVASADSGKPTLLEGVIDAGGALHWNFHPSELSIGDIQRTAAAKVQDIDPTRIYLVVSEPRIEGGNGLDALFELYRSAQAILPYVTGALSVLGIKTLKDALGLRKYWRSWIPVGGDARNLLKIARSPRTVPEASRMLQVNEEDAPTFLAFLGMSEDSEGTWLPGRNPENALLREIAEILSIASHRTMPPGSMTGAMLEIMDKPPGKRVANVDSILSKHQIENRLGSGTQHQKEISERHVFWSRGFNDIIDVWLNDTVPGTELDETMENRRIVRLVETAPFVVVAFRPDGSPITDQSGQPVKYSSFDEAFLYIRDNIL